MASLGAFSHADFQRLRALDTCSVSNAIERFRVRLRNEGFASGAIRCLFPHFAPMLGYAATAKVRTSLPPMRGRFYNDNMDWWNYVATIPQPRVIVFEDVDDLLGFGAVGGEIHSSICMALNCAGQVTNGAVRDLPAVESMGFHLFAGSVSVSHAFAHIVEIGVPVEIGGLKILPGDLIHGDRHGVQTIPLSIAPRIPEMVSKIRCQEQKLIEFCRSPEFSLDQLAEKLQQMCQDGPEAALPEL